MPLKKKSNKKKESASEVAENTGIYLPTQRRLGSCMTHRSDIIWIDSFMKSDEILGVIKEYPHFNRFPVCSGMVDSVVGVLKVRVFLESLVEKNWLGLKALVKKPIYVPETVTILNALSILKDANCEMAFIVDEYGGIEGLVTRNGIISELLEVVDGKQGEDDPDLFQRDDGSWLIGGQIRMDDIREQFGFPDAASGSHEYHTLAGYLLALNGNIPKTGDKIAAGSYICEIVDMDGHRIDKVLVQKA